jgi:hypothetical protein
VNLKKHRSPSKGPMIYIERFASITPSRMRTARLTTPFALAGQTMLPSVSVPNDTAAKFDDTAAPEPTLEPHVLRSMP